MSFVGPAKAGPHVQRETGATPEVRLKADAPYGIEGYGASGFSRTYDIERYGASGFSRTYDIERYGASGFSRTYQATPAFVSQPPG